MILCQNTAISYLGVDKFCTRQLETNLHNLCKINYLLFQRISVNLKIRIRPLRAIFICMKINREYILERLQEIVAAKGLLLIDLVIRGDSRNRIVEVYIDSVENVDTKLCSDVSRKLQEIIDKEGLLEPTYRLDVSTPGVDRPLKFLQQFFKHINRNFEVSYDSDKGQSKKVKGKLVRIVGDDLYFERGKEEYKVNFDQIKKAKVLISF